MSTTDGLALASLVVALAGVVVAVLQLRDGRRKRSAGTRPRASAEHRLSPELTSRGAYRSRRIRPGLYVTVNGRYRETRVDEHPDPRHSPATPWLLERIDGLEPAVIDFYASSDTAFAVAAALDGVREMPEDYAPRATEH